MNHFKLMCFCTLILLTNHLFAKQLNSVIETTLSKKSVLPPSMRFKKITQSELRTHLPFNSFCGVKLKIIPPNNQLAMDFAQKTAMQSFTYDYKEKEDQWIELKKCYTELGWKSFKAAMSHSGNNQSIRDEKLFVQAVTDGEVQILGSNTIAPTWKILVPIKVRYESDTHYLEQVLKVKLVLSIEKQRLGVDQIIASPILQKHIYEKPLDPFNKNNSTNNLIKED